MGNLTECGEWRLEREIGHGAYGTVYLAERRDGGRAAVKVCRRDATGEERYGRELRGAKLYRAVPPDAGLVRMREISETPWGFYMVMDLADDEFDRESAASADYRPKTLAGAIEGEKALPLKECVKLGIALANGLATLQRHHLLHRDIKPGNVLYVDGRPVLSDPGLVVEETEAASLVGTPGYVPPENFTGATSDIYSLGLTLKAASFGRSPEDLDKGPAPEADTAAKAFPAWWRILNRATDPVPSRRYRSAKAMLKDLEKLRRMISLTEILASRVVKAAIALAVLGAAAVVLGIVMNRSRQAIDKVSGQSAEIEQLKETYPAGLAALTEETLRETLKGVLSEERLEDEVLRFKSGGRYSSWGAVEGRAQHRGGIESWVDIITGNLAKIAKVDKTEAAKLQSRLDDLLKELAELDAKDASLLKQIKELHVKGKKKVEAGKDDKEEFSRAKKIDEQRSSSFGTVYARMKELNDKCHDVERKLKIPFNWDGSLDDIPAF